MITDKDTKDAIIEEQNKTINEEIAKRKLTTIDNKLSIEEQEKRLKWYEKNYGPYIEERGLRNWKNLFKKPRMMDILILIILIGVLYTAWAYNEDVQMCQNTLRNLPRDVCEACSEFRAMAKNESLVEIPFNFSDLVFLNKS